MAPVGSRTCMSRTCNCTTSLLALFALFFTVARAAASVFPLPADGSAVVGSDATATTAYEDTLPDIAHRYSLGYYEIIRANPGIDVWLPGAGRELTLPGRRILPPGKREGIVVNIPEHRLYYFPKPRGGEQPVVITYPVSIGKMDWRTPLGETHVIAKIRKPAWYPPESIRKEHAANGDPLPKVVPPGPDNPLGDFALRLAAGNGEYMIHGTNNPVAVGMAVTHGCIRMYPEDVAALFALVPIGTPVRLVNEPVKVAWVDGQLFLEAHPPVDAEGQSVEPDLGLLSGMLEKALGSDTAAIHWDLARATLQAANGMPTLVGLAADPDNPPPAGSPGAASTAPTASTPPPATPPAGAPSAATPPTNAAPTASVTQAASDVQRR
jgi:L,D-transpeptidase ErfK/SrfK